MVLDEAKILNKYIIITDTAAREAVADYERSIILKNDENMIYDGLKNVIINANSFNSQPSIAYDSDEKINKIINLIEEKSKIY